MSYQYASSLFNSPAEALAEFLGDHYQDVHDQLPATADVLLDQLEEDGVDAGRIVKATRGCSSHDPGWLDVDDIIDCADEALELARAWFDECDAE